ncbi:MAG: type I glyceraldehyde-3-phosphate dehydrogenase [Deltaproteobacteria bacterium]|nr:type I glyceraldehyde-3-phosphate dehydrogenase [Deltaproteobacteria bacterium]
MSIRIAINGFGRIGRSVLRAICDRGSPDEEIDLAAIADISTDADHLAYLIKYDSIHGRFRHDVSVRKSNLLKNAADTLVIGSHTIRCLPAAGDPSLLPWKDLGVDLVVESSGLLTNSAKAYGHIQAGAKKVIITAPGEGEVKTIVMGANENEYDPSNHNIISSGSCTMNALGMLVHVLIKEGIGIETGLLTAINSYTASQRLVDGISKKDRRSGRAAAMNIIPTPTSAARTAWEVFPALKGKISGVSYRVPSPDVSTLELIFRSVRDTSIKELDALIKKASETYLNGYLGYTEDELVSTDFINDPRSAIYDSEATIRGNMGDEKRLFRIISWHDNEWGHANRILDLIKYLQRH